MLSTVTDDGQAENPVLNAQAKDLTQESNRRINGLLVMLPDPTDNVQEVEMFSVQRRLDSTDPEILS